MTGCGDVKFSGPVLPPAARALALRLAISETATTAAADEAGSGALASLAGPVGLAVGPDGSLYVAEQWRSSVRRLSPLGALTTVAGTGEPLSAVTDQVAATRSGIELPRAVAVDLDGNLYICEVSTALAATTVDVDSTWHGSSHGDFAGRIRRVDVRTGTITTLCGAGTLTHDNVRAASSSLLDPQGIAVDSSGNVYVAEAGRNRVRVLVRVDSPDPAGQYLIRTVLGPQGPTAAPGVRTTSTDDFPAWTTGNPQSGPGTSLRIATPMDVALDGAGNRYVAESNGRLLRVDAAEQASVVVANAQKALPVRTIMVSSGKLLVGGAGTLSEVDLTTFATRTLTGGTEGFAGDGQAASRGRFGRITDLVAAFGKILIADAGNDRVRALDPVAGTVATQVGQLRSETLPLARARLGHLGPMSLAAAGAFDVFLGDTGLLRRLRDPGTGLSVETVAGDGSGGDTGDGLAGTLARVGAASAVVAVPSDFAPGLFRGDVVFADAAANRVRVWRRSTGTVAAYAGSGAVGQGGDGGVATLFTVAGGGSDDGRAATAASLAYPRSAIYDGAGNLYVGDSKNRAIRKVNRFGVISTVIATSSGVGTAESGVPPFSATPPGEVSQLAVDSPSTQLAVLDRQGKLSLYLLDTLGSASSATTLASSQPVGGTGEFVGAIATDAADRLYVALLTPTASGLSLRVARTGGSSLIGSTIVVSAAEVPSAFSRVTAMSVEPDGRRIWLTDGKQLAYKDLGAQ
ncbi:MAG: SBBP repeat-containing protein [Candidatus Riflebacteria bacterium]|nr:SBBP repeat-containing protein [Candidatus Riflebacteria bacterium]